MVRRPFRGPILDSESQIQTHTNGRPGSYLIRTMCNTDMRLGLKLKDCTLMWTFSGGIVY